MKKKAHTHTYTDKTGQRNKPNHFEEQDHPLQPQLDPEHNQNSSFHLRITKVGSLLLRDSPLFSSKTSQRSLVRKGQGRDEEEAVSAAILILFAIEREGKMALRRACWYYNVRGLVKYPYALEWQRQLRLER